MLRFAALAIIALVPACAAAAPERAASASTPLEAQAAVLAVLQSYAAARARGDIDAEMQAFAADADIWSPLGRRPRVVGKNGIRADLAGPPQQFRIDPVYVTFLDDDVAMVEARVFGADPEPSSLAMYILVRRETKWLIRSLRIMRRPTTPTPATAR